jgi:hypothetical protein
MIQENRFSLIVDDENSFFFCFFPFIEHLAFPSDEDFEQQSIICIPHVLRINIINIYFFIIITIFTDYSQCRNKMFGTIYDMFQIVKFTLYHFD